MALAFSNRKKSWKSRGSGIIRVRSLAQQFHPFKPFLDRLPAPKSHLVPAVVQTDHRNLPPIDPSRLCQWRYHAARVAEVGWIYSGFFACLPALWPVT